MTRQPPRPEAWGPQTRMVRAGLDRSPHKETAEALYLNSGYVYDGFDEAVAAFDGSAPRYVYSRFANPTVNMFEQRLAAVEGAPVCRATATGMAAVHAALMCQVRAGDRVVAARALFGSCHWIVDQLLPRYGVETVFVDGEDLDQWRAALDRPTRAVLVESPSNPNLEIVDLPAVADLAHRAGACLIVDNAFATPVFQKPLDLGADIVVHSATKFIDGQGRCLGGAIMCSEDFLAEHLGDFLRHTGPGLSPFNAWVLLKGLETLGLRMARHDANARRIAEFLAEHPAVAAVRWPGSPAHPRHALAMAQMSGGGPMVAVHLKGGRAAVRHVLDRLTLIDISNNLGDAKSLASHPATTTHQRLPATEKARLGITDGLVRLSVGLEDAEDLTADLAWALAGAPAG